MEERSHGSRPPLSGPIIGHGQSQPSKRAEQILERWIERKIGESRAYEPPESLQKLAIRNGKSLGMKVKFLFTNEWQVHMTTKRGTVIAAPMIREQTCERCRGTHVIPHILDGGGEPCQECSKRDRPSVTVEQAWHNSLRELGLLSS